MFNLGYVLSKLAQLKCITADGGLTAKLPAARGYGGLSSGGFRGGDGGDASPPTSLKVTILAEKSASVSNNSAPFRDASPPPT